MNLLQKYVLRIETVEEPQTVELFPERAVYWPERKTLLAADLHWGKSQTFRRHGIPIPGGILQEDLARLSEALRQTGAERLIILGDLIHAKAGLTEGLFDRVSEWRKLHDGLQMILIRGNHDRHCRVFPAEWRLQTEEERILDGPFAFSHHPDPVDSHYVWAGHVHPTVSLISRGDRLRLPCFHIGPTVGVLPAFSLFTGGYNICPEAGDRVIAIAGPDLIQLS